MEVFFIHLKILEFKHDFSIENEKPLEKSKYLGGEGYKDEEINNLKKTEMIILIKF